MTTYRDSQGVLSDGNDIVCRNVYNSDLKKIIVALGSDDQLATAKNLKNTDYTRDAKMIEL